MKKYTILMAAYGVGVGINFKFGGKVANTIDAHRLIQHYQEEMGPETADKIVRCKWLIIRDAGLQRCRARRISSIAKG